MEPELFINNASEIKSIINDISLFNSKRVKITIDFLEFTDFENEALEKKINKHYNTCGCKQGKITGIIIFISFILLVSSGIISFSKLGIVNTILLYFAFSFAIMLCTKLISIWHAKKSLLNLSNQLTNEISLT